MFKNYRPDYSTLYPKVTIPSAVLTALRKADRVEFHFEYEIKNGKPIYCNSATGKRTDNHDPDRIKADAEKPREVSLDEYLEKGETILAGMIDNYADPLHLLLQKELYRELYRCLRALKPHEQKLIYALFFVDITECELLLRFPSGGIVPFKNICRPVPLGETSTYVGLTLLRISVATSFNTPFEMHLSMSIPTRFERSQSNIIPIPL